MLPLDIQAELKELIKNALLEYLLKRYIASLLACHGGLPTIDEENERPVVRIIRIRTIKAVPEKHVAEKKDKK